MGYIVYWKHSTKHRGKTYAKGRIWKNKSNGKIHIFSTKKIALAARRSAHNSAAGAKYWFGIRKRSR
jgi:hypothetical protein